MKFSFYVKTNRFFLLLPWTQQKLLILLLNDINGEKNELMTREWSRVAPVHFFFPNKVNTTESEAHFHLADEQTAWFIFSLRIRVKSMREQNGPTWKSGRRETLQPSPTPRVHGTSRELGLPKRINEREWTPERSRGKARVLRRRDDHVLCLTSAHRQTRLILPDQYSPGCSWRHSPAPPPLAVNQMSTRLIFINVDLTLSHVHRGKHTNDARSIDTLITISNTEKKTKTKTGRTTWNRIIFWRYKQTKSKNRDVRHRVINKNQRYVHSFT